MLINERHPIHDLIQAELRVKGSVLFPTLEQGEIRAALARAGRGLDHEIGEQALVFCDAGPSVFTLVTDRRVLCRDSEVRFAHAMQTSMKKGMLAAKLSVHLAPPGAQPRTEVLETGNNIDALGRFFTRLLTVAPSEREPLIRPLVAPSPDDPTGAWQATQWLGGPDDRAALLSSFVQAAHAKGMMETNLARDFVARIVLHHRNAHFGRGMSNGRYMSPVSMNDLSNAMVTLYGNPLSHSEAPVRSLDFDSRLRTASGAALASSALGLASAAVLGIGWVSTAQRRVERFRMLSADTGAWASYRLQDTSGRELDRAEPSLVNEVDVRLLAHESEILTRRVVLGWTLQTPELLSVDRAEIDARLREVLGGAVSSAPSFMRKAIESALADGDIDLEDSDNLIVRYPRRSFEDVRSAVMLQLGEGGWGIVPDSETDGASVAATLREVGQHDAADLAEGRATYGASFQRGERILCLTMNDQDKGGGLRLQLSRVA